MAYVYFRLMSMKDVCFFSGLRHSICMQIWTWQGDTFKIFQKFNQSLRELNEFLFLLTLLEF